MCGFSWSRSLRLSSLFSFLSRVTCSVSCLTCSQDVWQVWGLDVGWFACLWVEADYSDSFSYPVSWDDYSGAVGAWFGYFLDDFVAFHLDVDGFLCCFSVFCH